MKKVEHLPVSPILPMKTVCGYREVISYDENGEMLSDVTRRNFGKNGAGFVISYTEKMCDFLLKVKTGSIVRVFLYIAHHQNYGTDGVFGYRCSHKYLQQIFGMDKSTLWGALNYLKENFLVNESKIDGCTEFMVNPNYVTIGTDRKARLNEWNRRWAEVLRVQGTKKLALLNTQK